MAKKKIKQSAKVRVIVDPRDGSKDRWIDKEEVKRMIADGRLVYDLTNEMPCYP